MFVSEIFPVPVSEITSITCKSPQMFATEYPANTPYSADKIVVGSSKEYFYIAKVETSSDPDSNYVGAAGDDTYIRIGRTNKYACFFSKAGQASYSHLGNFAFTFTPSEIPGTHLLLHQVVGESLSVQFDSDPATVYDLTEHRINPLMPPGFIRQEEVRPTGMMTNTFVLQVPEFTTMTVTITPLTCGLNLFGEAINIAGLLTVAFLKPKHFTHTVQSTMEFSTKTYTKVNEDDWGNMTLTARKQSEEVTSKEIAFTPQSKREAFSYLKAKRAEQLFFCFSNKLEKVTAGGNFMNSICVLGYIDSITQDKGGLKQAALSLTVSNTPLQHVFVPWGYPNSFASTADESSLIDAEMFATCTSITADASATMYAKDGVNPGDLTSAVGSTGGRGTGPILVFIADDPNKVLTIAYGDHIVIPTTSIGSISGIIYAPYDNVYTSVTATVQG